MHPLAKLDQRYVWHPFTQMRDWLKCEPIVLVRGKGAVLEDVKGRKYLDANSSIWTNLLGHSHPALNAAIRRQLDRVAHTSALGLANEPASLLAAALVSAANPSAISFRQTRSSKPLTAAKTHKALGATPLQVPLAKVFFSDDGSTALEVALKLAFEFARRTKFSQKPRFLSLQGGYHGDTIGAVSLGHIDLFHQVYSRLLFRTDQVMAPYCYRCRFNRAKPQREDARQYRKCNWECVDAVAQRFESQKRKKNPYAAFVFEPLMQGAAGMIPQPSGWLNRVSHIARNHGALLIADEVMTGFGRTGESNSAGSPNGRRHGVNATTAKSMPQTTLFACHHEGVQPDFLALAKGLTGGYLPMAATLTTQKVFDAFLGEYSEFKTFFHGHSFTGNQLGSAAALASLDILQSPDCRQARRQLERALRESSSELWQHPQVGDIRQVGLVLGVELVKNWRTRESFPIEQQAGIRVCAALAKRGVLTRPIGNVIVLMPPYCTTSDQAHRMVTALSESIVEAIGKTF